MSVKIWLSPPHMSGHEKKYVEAAFDSNWIAPAGPNIEAFERALSTYIGSQNVSALASGTAALHLALVVLGISRGDIVLCQSLTFAASANPIIYQGAIPVFIDSEPSTWNLCPNALEDAIKVYIRKGRKPKAVIGVHLYGMPFALDVITEICTRYEIPLIEDAAEALGSLYGGQSVGTFGTLGIFSFNGNKIITSSAGGALTSNDEHLINQARYLSTQARDSAPHYEHSQIGYNYRISNICAGIGLGQMEVINERVNQRRSHFNFYRAKLTHLPGVSFQKEPDDCFSNRWLTTIIVDPKIADGITIETIRLNLQKENIESRPIWKPMHLQPVFKDAAFFGGKVAEILFQNGLCLPSGSNLKPEELNEITTCIKSPFTANGPQKDFLAE
jgi:dTDP-4-amino-4,6-dideoxygalactose transaminase